MDSYELCSEVAQAEARAETYVGGEENQGDGDVLSEAFASVQSLVDEARREGYRAGWLDRAERETP